MASDREDSPPGPEDQSEGEIVDSEGESADAGIPRLDSLKMTEEEQGDYDEFSLASVSVTKRAWRAQEDSNVFETSAPEPFPFSPGSPCNFPGSSQGTVS